MLVIFLCVSDLSFLYHVYQSFGQVFHGIFGHNILALKKCFAIQVVKNNPQINGLQNLSRFNPIS